METAFIFLLLSNVFEMFSFVFTHIIYLRIISIVSTIFQLLFIWQSESDAIQINDYTFNATILVINVVQLIILYYKYYVLNQDTDDREKMRTMNQKKRGMEMV